MLPTEWTYDVYKECVQNQSESGTSNQQHQQIRNNQIVLAAAQEGNTVLHNTYRNTQMPRQQLQTYTPTASQINMQQISTMMQQFQTHAPAEIRVNTYQAPTMMQQYEAHATEETQTSTYQATATTLVSICNTIPTSSERQPTSPYPVS